ncbi:molybdopterin synthase sulfur carrier subunit [Paraburkholderia tropica]|nr:molybdopterin synthase sulfur carrier subunit [Paraburkholderia tropica]MBB3001708.1 molybdopterin synthase sulfur carrier subunit [Paraburkholderia tropica]MBB6321096.1 molybdopterin synthase sulfur carrier subunit [Paraburkholderia tropica]
MKSVYRNTVEHSLARLRIRTLFMQLTIKYFASIRESLGVSEETLQVDDTPITIDALRKQLRQRGAGAAEALDSARPVRVAVNHEMVSNDFVVRQDSEIAFFPPVTGG